MVKWYRFNRQHSAWFEYYPNTRQVWVNRRSTGKQTKLTGLRAELIAKYLMLHGQIN